MRLVKSVFLLICTLILLTIRGFAQFPEPESFRKSNFTIIKSTDSQGVILEKAASIVPCPNQYLWQKLEFIAFTHFGMNTFTDSEWGDGKTSPDTFNPDDFNADQWAKVIHDAGLKMIILTAKHHDGFCLWPSKWTDYSVASSHWKNGKGDVVKEVADACRKYGLKFGIYLSPWDRHEASYGDNPIYNEFFRNQLKELLSNYGKITEVWFDGACGEGPNGKKQIYDWPSYYRIVRELQPDAVIAIMGPDVRWVGTESGYARNSEWSVVPNMATNTSALTITSQKTALDAAFIPQNLTDNDIGGRDKIMTAKNLCWYPAETDVSIRPGWFYHEKEDSLVKSPGKLIDIYLNSVGKNTVLLLNIPPNKHGQIQEQDIKSLMGMKNILDKTFANNLIKNKGTKFSDSVYIYSLARESTFNTALISEDIMQGQHIEKFKIVYQHKNKWKTCTDGTTVGYKRILRFKNTKASVVRLIIQSSRGNTAIKDFGLYKMD